MGLQVHNTLTRRKEPFEPLDPPRVGFYLCGLTVYDYAHIGHARTAVAFEVIRRWLVRRGYDVTFVENVTDVDDKIINRANELGRDPQEHAAQWYEICRQDLDALGVPPPDIEPKVTQHMDEIVRLITRLVEAQKAYVAPDGSVYFAVASRPDYGKLSNRSPEDMLAGARVEPAEGKRDPRDFALWKASKPGEPQWDSPWGPGRPGWHIECSAMSMRYLGESFDIHGGGVDLVFPHHENEIAQSEGATDRPFVKYWLHTGFLSVDGEKMSKSLGNYVTIQDILKETPAEVVRFFYAYTHYRSRIDFTREALAEAGRGLERLRRARDALARAATSDASEQGADDALEQARDLFVGAFDAAMDDDFNTREAIAALFGFATKANSACSKGVGGRAAAEALEAFAQRANVLTIMEEKPAAGTDHQEAARVAELVRQRDEARAKRDWDRADRIRDELMAMGVEVSDTKEGTVWRRTG
jgi:cysteinyl-tRNA synthetase